MSYSNFNERILQNFNSNPALKFEVTSLLNLNNANNDDIKNLNALSAKKNGINRKFSQFFTNSCITQNEVKEIEELNRKIKNYNSKSFLDSFQHNSMEDSFVKFKNLLLNSNQIDSKEMDKLLDMNYDSYKEILQNNTNEIKNLISEHKYEFLMYLDYKNLRQVERSQLDEYAKRCIDEIKARKEHETKIKNANVNVGSMNNTNVNNSNIYNNAIYTNNNYSNISNNCYNKSSLGNSFTLFDTGINSEEEIIRKMILYNDFRSNVGNQNLSDGEIARLFQPDSNPEKAAIKYFSEINRTPKLTLIYIYPNSSQKSHEFDFLQSPDELFMTVYKDMPNINEFSLYDQSGKEIILNPVKDKYIASLLKNKSFVYVRNK